MCNQQYECAINEAGRLPTVFAIFYPVLLRQRERIGENANGSLETHAMFAQIGPGLFWIPLKSQLIHSA
ncbi:hypothetical protein AU467_19185 [Mesorhizobium loti]|uniref:Uncharacterized protein n=1 Tax=Rhizobium loti TaxID=381 RepID=A0A101KTT5_RHILI|nr:hypothetical protein AU467_19185 [Mesorhizobium loti]